MKIRCMSCKEYVQKDSAFRLRLGYVCSEMCMRRYLTASKRPATANSVSALHVTARNPTTRVVGDVRRRDGDRCRYCGWSHNLESHHIAYRSEGRDHSEGNLITLCGTHHALVHTDKHRYQPLLRGLLWAQYAQGRYLTVPQLERWMSRGPDNAA